jgi:NDP-sugar pyrophosphorylase family protein
MSGEMKSGILLRACTFITDSPQNSGIFTISEGNRIKSFDEKKYNVSSVIANAAIYRFSKNIISYVSNLEYNQIDITIDVIPKILDKIELVGLSGDFIDIGTRQGLDRANLVATLN